MTLRATLLLLSLCTTLLHVACDRNPQEPIFEPDPFIHPYDTLPDRTTEWRETHGSDPGNVVYDADDADDGSIIVAGTATLHDNSTDYYLLKLDADGNRVWERSFGGSGDQSAHAVVATPDGGAVMAGYEGSGSARLSVVAVNDRGDVMWDTVYRNPRIYRVPWAMAPTPDGGFVITGKREGTGRPDALAMKIDALGGIVWEKGIGGTSQEIGYDIAVADDGSIAIAADVSSISLAGSFGGHTVTLLDPAGAVAHEWTIVRRELSDRSVALTAIGNDFLSADIILDSERDGGMRIRRFDRAGREIWSVTHPFPFSYSDAISLLPEPSGIVTVACTYSPFLEFDQTGALTGSYQASGWFADGLAVDAVRAADGGFFAFANSDTPHIGTDSEIIVVKVAAR